MTGVLRKREEAQTPRQRWEGQLEPRSWKRQGRILRMEPSAGAQPRRHPASRTVRAKHLQGGGGPSGRNTGSPGNQASEGKAVLWFWGSGPLWAPLEPRPEEGGGGAGPPGRLTVCLQLGAEAGLARDPSPQQGHAVVRAPARELQVPSTVTAADGVVQGRGPHRDACGMLQAGAAAGSTHRGLE